MNEAADTTLESLEQSTNLQPFRVGDILDSIFSLYRNNFSVFVSIALIYFLGVLIEYTLKGFISGTIQGALIPMLIALPFGVVGIGASVYATGAIFSGKRTTASDAFGQVFRRIIPILGSHIIVRLIFTTGLIGFSLSIAFTITTGGASAMSTLV